MSAIALEVGPHSDPRSAARAYMSLTRALTRAVRRGDEIAARRLLVRRERLLATLGARGLTPPRAVLSEVRALEAQTMVALGMDPVPGPAPSARGARGL